jgi:hypothetical protein
MSYQPQFAATAAPSPKKPISKWWWIGLLIAWIIFLIIGGALIGVDSSSCYGYDCDESDSTLNGAFACFAIGGILHLAFWILLVVWLTQRRRARVPYVDNLLQPQPPTAIYTSQPTYASPPQQFTPQRIPSPASPQPFTPQPFPIPAPIYPPQGPESTNSASINDQPAASGFCGSCGKPMFTRFCTQCGAQG